MSSNVDSLTKMINPVASYLHDRESKRNAIIAFLFVALLVVTIMSLGTGAFAIPPTKVVAIFLSKLGVDTPWAFDPRDEAVLLSIRLPRVVLGLCVGAVLAVGGAAMQGLFRNPLAEPGLVGISSGGALAAVTYIVFGWTIVGSVAVTLRPYLLPIVAFSGSFVTTVLIYLLSRSKGRTNIASLLLAGIAINAIAVGGIGLLQFLSDDTQLRQLNFWLLGGLGSSTWQSLLPALPLMLIPLFFLLRFARYFDALLLGETEAKHLGINVESIKRKIIVIVALSVGAAVALSGVINFVGLLVPHVLRLIAGPKHSYLFPASILAGGILILTADILARTLVVPAEFPIGLVTNLVGGPFFLWMLLRKRSQMI
ncbi:MAG: iron ABC transporter permease [Gammaproteobacteria bacterium]|nr:iron ABC transporter permease [Gammaproteobacteria bacterium]